MGVKTERELLARRLAAQWVEPAGGADARTGRAGAGRGGTGRDGASGGGAGGGGTGGDDAGGGGASGDDAGGSAIARTVAHLFAVQAQDFAQGCWALGVRTPGSTMADVDAALGSRAVVRSWPIRGTLHFCTPDDLRMMLSISADKTVRGMAARHRDLGLLSADGGDGDFERAAAVTRTELAGGGAASRTEFLALLEAGGIDTSGQRGMHLIWWLAHRGLVCWGPRSGTQQALVLLDEWAPPARELDRGAALGEFVARYVEGHGPTTLADFCWWSKTTVADARAGLALVRDRLQVTESDGAIHLAPVDEVRDEQPTPARATGHHALPGFDEYLLGYRSRSPAVPEPYTDRIVPGANGIFLPMLVSRGIVVGTWKRRVTSKSVAVTLEPFTALSRAEHTGFERSLHRYAAFLGLPLALTEVPPPAPPASAPRAAS
jgi:hypothetical protein